MNLRNLGALLLALMVAALPVAAQEQSGAINGVVTDATGAVVPGVTVEAKSASGRVSSSVTDSEGRTTSPPSPPGPTKSPPA